MYEEMQQDCEKQVYGTNFLPRIPMAPSQQCPEPNHTALTSSNKALCCLTHVLLTTYSKSEIGHEIDTSFHTHLWLNHAEGLGWTLPVSQAFLLWPVTS